MSSTLLDRYQNLVHDIYATSGSKVFADGTSLKLERIQLLLEKLGHPEKNYRSIHVAGTSGKGSVVVGIGQMLKCAGYTVGVHTSPHLQILNERMKVNGACISTTQLEKLWLEVRPLVLEVGAELPEFGTPSFFEIQVALALEWFSRQGVDVAVVEVGLGGRLDATNVLPAEVAVITRIGLDHTEVLGETLEEIALEKAGIIKAGQKVLIAPNQPSVVSVITTKAREVGAEYTLVQAEQNITSFQNQNNTIAQAAAVLFDESIPNSCRVQPPQVFPGRLEVVQENPLVLLDGAHNPQKMAALVSALQHTKVHKNKEWTVIFAAKEKKDATSILEELSPLNVETLILTEFLAGDNFFHPQPAEQLRNIAETVGFTQIIVIPNAHQAVEKALQYGKAVLVTGSLYLVGEVRSRWFPTQSLLLQAEQDWE
ncbi:MAG: hypothetical protein H6774_04605 [Pseudomonadales bacterium]|nr:hypothetical protein [Candidatus Woesebacteria bacterium]MCB9802339.1 hypothetical protein [Pseudomonadales bacterium]